MSAASGPHSHRDDDLGLCQCGQSGSGTVLVLGVLAVIVVLAVALAALGAAHQARVQAQTAADLAAIAAATALRDGYPACDVAGQVVARNGGQLLTCTTENSGIVRVTTAVAPALFDGWMMGPGQGRARAGPAASIPPVSVPTG